MATDRRQEIKQRARSIQKANRPKLTSKDYIERALVILVIVGILLAALFLTDTI